MLEKECLEIIKSGEKTAYELLHNANPQLIKRFYKACKDLKNLMNDVQKYFPDASYYTASGGLNILLGEPHDEKFQPQRELEAIGDISGLNIGDGDY